MQSDTGSSADELATTLGCSRRTVFRDLQLLRQSGVNVCRDDSGYRAAATAPDIPLSALDDDELTALIAAACSSPLLAVEPYLSAVQRGTAKAMASRAKLVQKRVARILRALDIRRDAKPLERAQQAHFLQLLACVQNQRQAAMVWNRSLEPVERIESLFSVYQIVGSQSTWFVTGQSSYHRRVVRIDLDQIGSITSTERHYHLPRKLPAFEFIPMIDHCDVQMNNLF